MTSSRSFLLAFTLLVAPAAAETPHAAVYLINEIAVEAPSVTLEEIAKIECRDPELKERLAALVVGKVPSVNVTRLVTAFSIENRLREEGLAEQVSICGERCTISTATREIEKEELLALLNEWVEERLASAEQLEIDPIRLPSSWLIPAGEEVEIEISCGHQELKGMRTFTLRALAHDQTFATTRAQLRISQFREMATLAAPLRRGECLEARHHTTRLVNSSDLRGYEEVDVSRLEGLSCRRNLKEGDFLYAKDFEQPVIFSRGDMARILIRNGDVVMQVTGAQALQTGRIGETIRFRNPMNKREPLFAEIVQEGLAQIILK